ncbi:MAG: TonB-dependent receptor [Proteobacteria bacterium]|nr:TonB-dependent receptor [Pseudomonadota bacterium]
MSKARPQPRLVQRTLLAVPMLAASLAAAAAEEQGPTKDTSGKETLQEVVVTGSRIARPDLERLEPTTVISAQTIDDRGYADIGQALSSMPGFGIPTNASNVQSSTGIGQSFVDLFSLGSQRTLTLVNGRRFVSSNSPAFGGIAAPGGQVDLNTIPTKLIDRVETVSVGGAPIYGADAISGTVNIILKHDFQGADVDVQFGRSGYHDADQRRVRGLFGTNFADNRGNVTVVGEFSKDDGLIGTQRPVYAADLAFGKPLYASKFTNVLYGQSTVTAINYGGVPLVDDFFFAPGIGLSPTAFGVTDPSTGALLAFGNAATSGSNLVPYNLGTQFFNNPVFSSGGDGERLSQTTNLLSPLERINVDTLGSFQLTDRTRLFAEGWFSETHAENLIAQPQYNTFFFGSAGQPQGNLVVSLNNPFLPAASRAAIQQALLNYQAALAASGGTPFDPNWSPNQFYLARASMDLESNLATANQVLARGVLGAEGKFDIGWRSFNWEISGNYGRSRYTADQPSIVWQNMQNALDAVVDPSTGQIVCAGTLNGTLVNAPTSTVSSTCSPLNIFGAGSPSQAARDYITHHAVATSVTTQRDFVATIGGDVAKLPAGEVKVSLGYENRRESAEFDPDSFYANALGTGAAILGIAGAYHTNEVFGELLVPLASPAQDIVLLHSLQLEGAIRRVDNSIAGTSNTWTAGLRWSPVQDAQFRGNKTRSIRAPAITELFLPAVPAYSFANDPCDLNFINTGPDPATRAKNCASEGIPLPIPGQPNTGFNSNVVNATALGTSSGNTHLTSETADSQAIGLVLRPRFVPRLNIALDYIDIKVTNAIENLDLTTIMDSCYDSADYPNNQYCKLFQRNGAHQVVNFQSGYVNAGNLHFTGITAAVDYSFDVPTFGHDPGSLGSLQLRASYLDTRRLSQQIGLVPVQQLDGQLGGTNTTGNVVKGKGVLDLAYHKGSFAWNWQAQFVGSANFSNLNPPDYQDYMRVNPWWVINSTLVYEAPHDITVRLIVDNVFNKEPPFPALAATGGNYSQAASLYFAGIMGRYFHLGLDWKIH